MPTTGAAKYPYPNASAVPDVPADLLLLAQRVALMAGAGVGYVADATERAALVTDGDAFDGFIAVQEDDPAAFYQYDGSDWWAYDTAWKTFTPTFTGGVTVGNGTSQGWRLRQGQLWKERIRLTLGSTSAVSGQITFSIAGSENSIALEQIGYASFRDDSAGGNYPSGVVMKTSGTAAGIYAANVGGTYPILASTSATVPFTWATADYIIAKYDLWLA